MQTRGSYLYVNDAQSDWLEKASSLSLIGYTSTREQLYAILIGCLGFFRTENKAKTFLQMSFVE